MSCKQNAKSDLESRVISTITSRPVTGQLFNQPLTGVFKAQPHLILDTEIYGTLHSIFIGMSVNTATSVEEIQSKRTSPQPPLASSAISHDGADRVSSNRLLDGTVKPAPRFRDSGRDMMRAKPRRKRQYSPGERLKVAEVRKLGACEACRKRKVKVSYTM